MTRLSHSRAKLSIITDILIVSQALLSLPPGANLVCEAAPEKPTEKGEEKSGCQPSSLGKADCKRRRVAGVSVGRKRDDSPEKENL